MGSCDCFGQLDVSEIDSYNFLIIILWAEMKLWRNIFNCGETSLMLMMAAAFSMAEKQAGRNLSVEIIPHQLWNSMDHMDSSDKDKTY